MSLFDTLIDQALRTDSGLNVLRPVVEKELLHHDIFREMSRAGLLAGLTFIGGTCLRACYGSERLSEDLDFTGGTDFKREDLKALGDVLTERLHTRYGLPVEVSAPVKTGGNVSTWKLSITTRPRQKNLPIQRIHLDICAIPSHDPQPVMLRNLYNVDLGTSGLILQAQSREEILADKMIALAFRENRIKNRDLWDILWLTQRGVQLPKNLIPLKIKDHKRTNTEFTDLLRERIQKLKSDPKMRDAFVNEMRRFLPAATVRETLENPDFWTVLRHRLDEEAESAINALASAP